MTQASWKIVIIIAFVILVGFAIQYQFLIKPLVTNASTRSNKSVKKVNTAEPAK